MLTLNAPAPLFTLPTVAGRTVALAEVLHSGRPAVLIFLRHLGCIPCREHVLELCARQVEFERYHAQVLIISFGTLPAVQQWLQATCGAFEVLLDRDRAAYTAYGLERSYWRSRSLRTRWYYLRAWLSGKKSRAAPGEDTSQLGGDFVVDRAGRLSLVHPSRDPADRPPLAALLAALAGRS